MKRKVHRCPECNLAFRSLQAKLQHCHDTGHQAHHRYRCPECRTRRTSFMALIEHCRDHGHKLCDCGGGGQYRYAHRPGSPYCVKNSMSGLRLAMLFGGVTDDELLDIQVECALFSPGRAMTEWRD